MGMTKAQKLLSTLPKNKDYYKKMKGKKPVDVMRVSIDPQTKQLMEVLESIIKTSKILEERQQAKAKLKELKKFQCERTMDHKVAKFIGNGDVANTFKGLRCVPNKKQLIILNKKELELEALINKINAIEEKLATTQVKARAIRYKKELKILYKQYEEFQA